ncbi:LemA family protein [Bacillus luti]|nr:membrane protein [Bacillus cereus]
MMTWIILGVVLLLVFVWIGMYNGLVKSRNWIEESWSQIDVQLKRRLDLIPNLVEVTKSYAKYEKETLERVIQARNQLVNNDSLSREEIMAQNDALSNSLKSIFALSESYPDLKAQASYQTVSEELISTENKIAYARQLYNTTANRYNIKIQTVPSNIVASVHGFKKHALLEATAEERQAVRVSFE